MNTKSFLVAIAATFVINLSDNCCNCSRILAIFPIPFHELQVIYQPLIETLASRGHQLVVLTTDPINDESSNSDNIQQIDLSFVYNLKVLDKLKDAPTLSGAQMMKTIFNIMRKITEAELRSEVVQRLVKDTNQTFDAVLVEWTGSALMNAFAHHFNAPLIGIANGGAFINSHEALGNPTHPVAYPNVLLPFSEDLNLLQRIASLMFTVWYRYIYFTEELPQQNVIAKEYFGSDLPDLWTIENGADLMLVNCYEALGNVRPSVPTTIYLGGLHARQPKRLHKDLQTFLDQSANGVIYMNLCSSIDCLTPNRLIKLQEAIEQSGMDIIWQTDHLVELNTTKIRLHQSSRLPQEAILAHQNIKLFITSGGQRSIEDAIHYAVPVLGISFSSYMEHYLRQIQKYESGVITFIDFETKMKFIENLNEVLHNSRYQKNVKNLKHLLADQPMSTKERAAWWIEYVIRNNGSKHLRSQMRELTWFQYMMLDVVITFMVCIFTIILLLFYIAAKLYNYSKNLPFEMVTRGSKAKVL